MFIVTCTYSFSRVGVPCHIQVFIVTCTCYFSSVVLVFTCRCSSDAKTALSTSTATGPATKTDSGTCLTNSGLVGEPLNKIHSKCWNSGKKPMISLMLHNQNTLTSSHLNKY